VEWAQVATVIAAIAGLIGLQTYWITRELDSLGKSLERLETRLDRLEGREPPSLRRV
jgi:ubiquinone biosynthesis protein UbiJ